MEHSNEDQNTKSKVTIFSKKNPKRKHLRRKLDDNEDEEDSDILKKLQEIRSEQLYRKRQKGIDALNEGKTKISESKTVADKSIKQMMGTQFSIQESGEFGGTLSHEKLMEQYIEEKIKHLTKQKDNPAKELTEEDKLFIVPDDIKALEGREIKESSTEGGGLSWSTGIAEVSLPIDYKIKNIEATEEAKRLRQQELEMARAKDAVGDKKYTLSLGNKTASYIQEIDRTNGGNRSEGFEHSTDDAAGSRCQSTYITLKEGNQMSQGSSYRSDSVF